MFFFNLNVLRVNCIFLYKGVYLFFVEKKAIEICTFRSDDRKKSTIVLRLRRSIFLVEV